ncbi:unnamed protein product [Choristocarpus tenellus]
MSDMVSQGFEGTSHKDRSHTMPESRVGDEGSSKRNITRKGSSKVSHRSPYACVVLPTPSSPSVALCRSVVGKTREL